MAISICLVISPARAVDVDGDGLLDLVDVAEFDPRASGLVSYSSSGIQDLDGANQLTSALRLFVNDNQITSIENGDFEGLINLEELFLGTNQITRIERGSFKGLTNLRWLALNGNQITSFENGAFEGLGNLETLYLQGNQVIELNLNGATFENLEPCHGVFGIIGFCPFNNPISSLILDDTTLNADSFKAIVREMYSITDVSLVGLTFSDQNPDDLNSLLGIATLNNVTVDTQLFDLYADGLNAFASHEGNSVTVVPEPSCFVMLLATCVMMMIPLRRQLHSRTPRNSSALEREQALPCREDEFIDRYAQISVNLMRHWTCRLFRG
jgi:hypothetical protein